MRSIKNIFFRPSCPLFHGIAHEKLETTCNCNFEKFLINKFYSDDELKNHLPKFIETKITSEAEIGYVALCSFPFAIQLHKFKNNVNPMGYTHSELFLHRPFRDEKVLSG